MGSPRSKDKDLRPYLKDPETRVCVQIIYLAEDSRKHLEVRREGKPAVKGVLFHGQPKLSFTGELWEPEWSMQLNVISLKDQRATKPHPLFAEGCVEGHVRCGVSSFLCEGHVCSCSQKTSPGVENGRCSEHAVLGV